MRHFKPYVGWGQSYETCRRFIKRSNKRSKVLQDCPPLANAVNITICLTCVITYNQAIAQSDYFGLSIQSKSITAM